MVTGGGEVFEAGAEVVCPVGDAPAVGGDVDVLHVPGARRRVLLDGPVPTAVSAAVDPDEMAAGHHVDDPPDPLTLVRDVLAGLREGTTPGVGGLSGVDVGADGTNADADVGTGEAPRVSRDLTGDELRNFAQTDPAGLARTMLDRIASGEMSLTDAVAAKETLGLDGRTVQRIIREVTTSGSLSPESLDAVRRAQGNG